MADTGPMWQPSPDRVAASTIKAFMSHAAARAGRKFETYDDLHRWSIDDLEGFWSALWDFVEPIAETRGERVLVDGDAMPGARFFPDARLNFAENMLRFRGPEPAMIFRREDGLRRETGRDELVATVARLQRALEADGLEPGERVAGYMANVPDAIAAMLAGAALGGVWTSCSPDFGVQGVLDRFGQTEPRVLFAVDGYLYAGKRIDIRDKLREIVDALPSVKRVVVVPFLEVRPDLSGIRDAVLLDDYLAPHADASEPGFRRLPFDHPLYVLYSSGTTGVPKCILHGAGATLLTHLKEQRLHVDVKPGDRLYYFTTLGWMMWNWLASGLGSGATLMLYDGSPFHPGPEVVWDFAAEERVTILGLSAKYVDAIAKAGLEPRRTHDLSALKTILTTGSTLVPESYDYIYEHVKSDVLLSSMSGGTDLCGCFVTGNPIGPVWRGEIQAPALAMAVEVFDDEGRALSRDKGELVCTRPFPTLPLGFWGDEDGSRYRDAYFSRFPGVWCHGDWASWTGHGGMMIYGRSDATLNPGGVRIGTAEIYREVERLEEVVESIVIGQEWDNDTRVILFVRLREGLTLDAELEQRIRDRIRRNASPRHVPARIVQVSDIPRTRSGKIVELAVRDVVHGREVKNVEALDNPQALEQFRDRRELAG